MGLAGSETTPLALSDFHAVDFSKVLYVDHFFMLA
jgi:hypothetical protein